MINNPLRKPMSSTTILALLVSLSACATTRGPTTSTTPYLVPVAEGVEFVSILTAGDEVKTGDKDNATYRMAGTPDGLGAYDNNDGSITVLMNHEFSDSDGVARAHGSHGAFVSTWQIRKTDLKVLNGGDLIKNLQLADPSRTTFNRLCSADLAAPTAFFNNKTGKGFNDGRIFMGGEEAGKKGRAFAHIASGRERGTSFELPALGIAGWENLVASPHEQDKTIVAGLDDGGHNKVYFYIGEKQSAGDPVERAGLAQGTRYALEIDGYTDDNPVTGFKGGRFSLTDATQGTVLARPEDGAWDTTQPNRFYFVTTAGLDANSRLWRMTFDDIARPETGGSIEVLIDGSTKDVKMMDNITVDTDGNVYLQEDVGDHAHLGRVWMYNPNSNGLTLLAQHDPARFDPAVARPLLTQNEESSGIIEVTHLFAATDGYDPLRQRYFLLDVQAHYGIPGEVVKGGQLLMMKVKR